MKIFFLALLFSVLSFVPPSYSQDFKNYCILILNDSNKIVSDIVVKIEEKNSEPQFIQTDISGKVCFSLNLKSSFTIVVLDSNYSLFTKKISSDEFSDFSVDTVKLKSKIVSTDVITVEAQKDFMRIEDDKTIYDISKIGLDPGPNALELMKKIPMLTVEGENVLLRGSAPKILIDGRESEIYGDLKSIPTDLIDRVEVMTIAPSKYEAEGVNGVVNVILKKFEEAKYRIFLSSYLSSNNTISTYENASFKKGKFSFFLNTNGYIAKYSGYNSSYTKNLTSNEITLISNDTSNSDNKSFRVSPGLIFDANENLYIGIEGGFSISNSTDEARNLRQYPFLQMGLQQLFRNNNSDNSNYSIVTYLSQSEIFKKDELNVEFNMNNVKNNSNYDQTQLANNLLVPFSNGSTNAKTNSINIKIDYSKKFGDNLRIESGLRQTFKKENNLNNSVDTSGMYSANYEFRQSIYSYYGTLSYNNKLFRFKPGLRIEYADLRGLVAPLSEFTNFKLDVFPSLTITKFFEDNSQLQVMYGRKIDRPRFNTLNPFTTRRDVYNTSSGNPELLPSYTNNYELKFSKPIGDNYFNANISYKHNSDLIQNLKTIDSVYTRTTYINNGYSDEFGFDAVIRFKFSEFLFGSFFGSISKKVYSDETLNLISNRITYRIHSSMGYSNPKVIDANVYVYYSGRNTSPYSISQPSASVNFYASKSFFNSKLNLSLAVNDILNGSVFENTYVREGFEQYSKSFGSYGRNLSLNISYTFGNYDEKRQRGKEYDENSD